MIDARYKTYIRLARLHRTMPIWLLLFPSWWGIALASPAMPSLYLLILFACGAIIMRSAGCVYNDIIDQDLDAQVSRTAVRPLAAKELSSKEAVTFLCVLLGLGALILFSLPPSVVTAGFIALGLVFLYPWMKRMTYWPQLFLGFTFNMGILMGWLCLHPTLSSVPFLFYGGAVLWTIGYDTIYAFQDREDDLLAGIKSSALAVSSSPKIFLCLVYGSALVFWGIGAIVAQLNWIYWFFLILIAIQLAWQTFFFREDDARNCLKRFESNRKVGLLLFIAIVFSRLIN
ncbi:MAG: 4-hydroxybenzoate octaprenyltransferase [Alphaproteobacteria bacterium]|nr:4-hydroxybenzoate octaprenyltransferase [Alphaproteobacteria bacterium]